MSRVAIENRSVTIADLTKIIQHDDLSEEISSSLWRVVLGIASNETTAQLLHRHVLDVESTS